MRTISILVSLAVSISAAACVDTPDDPDLDRTNEEQPGWEAVTSEGTPLPSVADELLGDQPGDEPGLLYLPRCSSERPQCPPGTRPVCYLGEYQCW